MPAAAVAGSACRRRVRSEYADSCRGPCEPRECASSLNYDLKVYPYGINSTQPMKPGASWSASTQTCKLKSWLHNRRCGLRHATMNRHSAGIPAAAVRAPLGRTRRFLELASGRTCNTLPHPSKNLQNSHSAVHCRAWRELRGTVSESIVAVRSLLPGAAIDSSSRFRSRIAHAHAT